MKKELIEHKVAFIYVPAIFIIIITLTFLFGMMNNGNVWQRGAFVASNSDARFDLFNFTYAASVMGWLLFMLIMLFFYFAASFSSDRKDNALLFWKSLPVSDLQIISTKTIAGMIMFPIVIMAWSIIAAIATYIAFLLVSINIPIVSALNLAPSVPTFLNLLASMLVLFTLTLLWYLPLFSAVGLLGTILRGWAVPAFILIMLVGSGVEALATFSGEGYFAALMEQRFKAPFIILSEILPNMEHANPINGLKLTEIISIKNFAPNFASSIDWVGMILGWVAAGIFIFIASEYRRRRIQA